MFWELFWFQSFCVMLSCNAGHVSLFADEGGAVGGGGESDRRGGEVVREVEEGAVREEEREERRVNPSFRKLY